MVIWFHQRTNVAPTLKMMFEVCTCRSLALDKTREFVFTGFLACYYPASRVASIFPFLSFLFPDLSRKDRSDSASRVACYWFGIS